MAKVLIEIFRYQYGIRIFEGSQVKRMKIEIIDTGFFYADGGAMFGSIPKTSWSKRYPSNEVNGCVLAMRSLLIKTDCGRVVLVDTGAGNKHLRLLNYYNFFGLTDLCEELNHRGISTDGITDVVLTHLHFDHCGYVTSLNKENGQIELTFPNAKHWVSEAQWKCFINPHPMEKASFIRENMDVAMERGVIELLNKDCDLLPGIRLQLYDGHTPGQIVPCIDTIEGICVFAGDVIPLAASVSPGWISAYDTNPLRSYDEKIRMLECAAEEKQVLIFCHDAYTVSATVKKIGSFFKIDKIISSHK